MINKNIIIPAILALVTAWDKNSHNRLVISHGSIGVGFGTPIFTLYVKPERYTF